VREPGCILTVWDSSRLFTNSKILLHENGIEGNKMREWMEIKTQGERKIEKPKD